MKKYSIGLDIGTASVGWVCISPDYKILKYNERFAMGVHEFESAKVAAERRIQRGTRRRYNRRKKRLQLLQSIFQDHMYQYPDFFAHPDTKHFWRNHNDFENRTLSETLRAMKINTKQFPTLYHLRNYLINTNEKEDLRLIYLALHHLVKYRGHFLNENLKWGSTTTQLDLSDQIHYLMDEYADLNAIQPLPKTKKELDEIQQVLLNTKITRSDRLKSLKLNIGKEYESLFNLLLGLKTGAEKLFPLSENTQMYKEQKLKLQISSEEFDSQLSFLTETEARFLENIQPLYQQMILHDLLNGATCVAHAKVKGYEKFEQQLSDLKYVVDKFAGEKTYRSLFITSKKNKVAYNKKPVLELLCLFDQYLKNKKGAEPFFNQVKNILKAAQVQAVASDKQKIEELLVNLENEQLLVKQRSIHNAAIPHQNNMFEAQQIVKNQQAYYPFMTEDWLNKVIEIISFRIPYYIGPLGKSEFSWMERNKVSNITPWNFEGVVNKAASAEAFIQRMTSQCSYLKSETVLPKQSLLYEKFELLNELNGVQIRSKTEQPDKKFRLDEEIKKWIIENVFKKHKSVTHERVLNELKKSPYYAELELEGKQLFGTQKEDRFVSVLASHIQFSKIIENYGEEVTEQIIYYLTIFSEKEIIKHKIQSEFPQIITEDIEAILKMTVTGWGRLSRKLLDGLVITDDLTVIEYMERFSMNFMEVQSQSNLKGIISELNPKIETKKIRYEDVKQLAGSPALKRGIWRAIKIVEELTAIFGEPEQIMIEVAREDQASRMTKSNKQLWEDLGKEWKDHELKIFHKSVNGYPTEKFRNQRFWLYVTQHGKCMYSGEPLTIEDLDLYDVDHIYPRSFVVDNSYDNLVLVKKHHNQRKGNTKTPLEVIPPADKYKVISLWEQLHEKRLISKKKLDRLLKDKFNDQDKEGFINRQLVETRQIIMNVKDLLQERFSETQIHLVKAGIVTKFRKALKLPKTRDYNNKHHAMDAVLTTILIQFIQQKYGENFLAFNFKQKERKSKWEKIAQTDEDFFVFKAFNDSSFTSNITSKQLEARLYIQEIFYELPWQTTKMTGNSDGMFYKETIFSPKVKTAKYNSVKSEKFVHDEVKNLTSLCIKYTFEKKGKEQTHYKIFDLKVIENYQQQYNDQLALYLVQKQSKEQVISAEIVYELPKYQKIEIEGHPYYFISSGELHNAKQWKIPRELVEMINSKELKENSAPQLKVLFNEIAESFFAQYLIYNHDTFKSKVRSFIEKELMDITSFEVGLKELYKSAAANATRSEKFGSRLSKKANPAELSVIYESITGLRYRKPKMLQQIDKTKQQIVRS